MDGNSAGSTPKMDWTSRDLPAMWKAFRQHCEFTFGGPLKRKSEEEKCNYLMIWIGDKGRDIYNTWELTAEEAKKLDTYYTKYEAYVKPKSNKVFARYKFHQKVQQEGESFEQFLTDLKLLVTVVMQTLMKWFEIEWLLGVMLPKQQKSLFRKVQTLL